MGQVMATAVEEDGVGIGALTIFDFSDATMPVASTSRPEYMLILTIARVELSASARSLFQELLSGMLDWDYVLDTAELHGLEPLLLRHLRSVAAAGVVPDEVMQRLRHRCKIIALRNLLLSSKLREISKHLTSRQIKHIAYKGPLLAEIYSSDGSLRAYRDLDLLVPQRELGAVRDALREVGFVDRYGLTEARQADSFQSGYEHPFTSCEGIDLDVHWRIVQKFKSRALDMDGLWKRKTEAQLLDQDVPALSPEDLLAVLCLHAGHHGWMRLSYMCDLAQLFHTHENFDWKIVRSHMGDSNTRRIVCMSLYLLRKHWQADIPEDIAILIQADPNVERLAQRIETEIWPSEKPELTTANLRWLLDRTAGEDWRDRIRLLAGSIFVPSIEDFALFKLPQTLSYLYGALRILRLGWKRVSIWASVNV